MEFSYRRIAMLLLCLFGLSMPVFAQENEGGILQEWEPITVESVSQVEQQFVFRSIGDRLSTLTLVDFIVSPETNMLAIHLQDLQALSTVPDSLIFWRLDTMEVVATQFYPDGIMRLRLSPDGNMLAVISGPKIDLFNLREGELALSLDSYTGALFSDFGPNNHYFMYESGESEISILDLTTYETITSYQADYAVGFRFCPDSRCVAYTVADGDSTLKLWYLDDDRTEEVVLREEGFTVIGAWTSSLSGQYLVVNEQGVLDTDNPDETEIHLEHMLDLETLTVVNTWQEDYRGYTILNRPSGNVFLFVDPASLDAPRFFNIETNTPMALLSNEILLAINPDETLYASTDHTLSEAGAFIAISDVQVGDMRLQIPGYDYSNTDSVIFGDAYIAIAKDNGDIIFWGINN